MPKPYSNALNLTNLLLRWKNELKNSSSNRTRASLADSHSISLKAQDIELNNNCHISALMGTDGSLPREMSLSGMISESEKGTKAVTDFFAIFEKYYFDLLYKSQFKYNWSLLYEQQAMIKKTSKLSLLLNSLCRKKTENRQHQSHYYNGISILAPSNKRLKNLKYWLEHYFEASFCLQYAAPKYQYLESENITKLSENNNKLGVNTLLGNQCSLYGDRIDLLLEVSSIAEFDDWREDKERIRLIYEACHFYYKMEAKFNIKIRVPSYILPKNEENEKAQLGVSAFLGKCRNSVIEIAL